ncbi:MAG: hypothetical protein GY771_06045 [bacterium]|nr:hypothetical protein [bacterium]
MDELLKRGIKEIIDEYPGVGDILDEYEIGCVPCGVGTCILGDIVDIHNLSAEDENVMLTRIAEIVLPGEEVDIPLRERSTADDDDTIKYSPPIQKLVDEHKLIKRLLALIPEIVQAIDLEIEDGRQTILDCVDFIRNYADKFHHAKEEDILFKYFDDTMDIFVVMYTDHDTGRSYVRAIVEAVEARDKDAAAEKLTAYRELLTEHIKEEDEILYPWLDKQLSDGDIGRMFARFAEVDVEFGDAPSKYRAFIERLESLNIATT